MAPTHGLMDDFDEADVVGDPAELDPRVLPGRALSFEDLLAQEAGPGAPVSALGAPPPGAIGRVDEPEPGRWMRWAIPLVAVLVVCVVAAIVVVLLTGTNAATPAGAAPGAAAAAAGPGDAVALAPPAPDVRSAAADGTPGAADATAGPRDAARRAGAVDAGAADGGDAAVDGDAGDGDADGADEATDGDAAADAATPPQATADTAAPAPAADGQVGAMVESEPPGAAVVAGGSRVGKTPCEVRGPSGTTLRVYIRKKNFANAETKVRLGRDRKVVVPLQPAERKPDSGKPPAETGKKPEFKIVD